MTTGMTANIAWYLFLAGAGGGAYLVALALEASGIVGRKTQFASLFPLASTLLSTGLVLAGSAFLYFDLGVPDLFMLAFNMLGKSVISFGALSICLFLGFCALRVLLLRFGSSGFRAKLETACRWLAGLFALTTASYTGYFLYTMKAVPFWDTPLVIALFLLSSLSTGAACLIGLLALARMPGYEGLAFRICRIDSALLALEALVLAAYLGTRFLAGGSAAALALELVAGAQAPIFWAGIVFAGIALPLALERLAARQRSESCALLAAGGILAGGLLLRCSIILV